VALVGTTGAGKSTVARILSGIIEPTGGVAVLDGKQLISYEMTSLRENVALISQDAHVFSGTVRDNLTLGAPAPCSEVQLQEAIGTCHAQWINDLPQGLDSMLGSNGHQLTSHQQQHLALVRIAVLNPRIVVMDEATAEAGSRNSRELDKAANALTKDRTTLIIAHRLSQARSADRIIVMDHGEIIEDGTHRQLLAANGKYAKLWRAWEG